MVFTLKDQQRGGQSVAKKYGSEYMRKIGKRGRKKQLDESKSKLVPKD